MDHDDWDTVTDFATDIPALVPASVAILLVFLVCLALYVSSQVDDCKALAEQRHFPYHEYTLGKGCVVGQAQQGE